MTSAAPDTERSDAEPLRGLAPDAPAARYAADWRLLLFAPAALLLQVAHPVIGSGVAQHSIYRRDPVRRFDRSYWATLALAFYGDETADYGRDIRALHKPIGGTDHAGRRYHAWDPEAYFWVLATGYWASTLIADRIEDGLTRAERAELYAGWRQMSLLAGLRERDAPADLDDFETFFDRVLAQRLERHPSVQDVYDVMRRPPAPARVPNLLWKPVMWGVVGPFAAWVNTGVLPPETRKLFGRTWTRRDERLLRLFFRTVRATDRILPDPIRGITRTVAMRRRNGITSTVRAAADAA